MRSVVLAFVSVALASSPVFAARSRPEPDVAEHRALAAALIRAYAGASGQPRRVAIPPIQEASSVARVAEVEAAVQLIGEALLQTTFFTLIESAQVKDGDLHLRYAAFHLDRGPVSVVRLVEQGSNQVVAMASWPPPREAVPVSWSAERSTSSFVERDLAAGTWGTWLSFSPGFVDDHSSMGGSLSLRSPSGHWEGSLFGGFHSGDRRIDFVSFGRGSDEQFDYAASYLRLIGSYRYAMEYVGVPGVYRLQTPAELRLGAGLSLIRLDLWYRAAYSGGTTQVATEDNRYELYRVAPTFQIGVSKSFSNVFEAEVLVQYTLTHALRGIAATLPFDGAAYLLRLGYRLF